MFISIIYCLFSVNYILISPFNFSVNHDFYTAFGKTKIFVQKKNEGYGLVCHRAIKEICQAIGIKDLRAKVEGSNNLQHLVKAFFIGLLQQVSIKYNIYSCYLNKKWMSMYQVRSFICLIKLFESKLNKYNSYDF